MLELYQIEECPYCARVRARMTDLCIDYIIRNEPRDRGQRERLYKVSGQRYVPTLIDSDKNVVITDDDDAIIRYIEKNYEKGKDKSGSADSCEI